MFVCVYMCLYTCTHVCTYAYTYVRVWSPLELMQYSPRTSMRRNLFAVGVQLCKVFDVPDWLLLLEVQASTVPQAIMFSNKKCFAFLINDQNCERALTCLFLLSSHFNCGIYLDFFFFSPPLDSFAQFLLSIKIYQSKFQHSSYF